MVEPFPLIEVTGAARQRGRQYGRQAVERIRKGAAHYTAQLRELRLGDPDIRDLVARFLPRIDAFDPSYSEEMRGIAEGAEVGLESIALLNARTEILKLGQREAAARKDAVEDGCTGAVLLPEATADGVLVHGQNWDWKAECAETAVVLKARPDNGPAYLTFTEAGALARSGFNDRGIGLTANYLECDRDYRTLGVPLVFIRRKVLESEHFALAMRTVYCTAKSCANNMMLSMADGFAIDFECAPDDTFPVHAERGLIVHANHFQSAVALGKLKETGIASVPESLYRDVRVRQALARKIGALNRDDLRNALFDDFGTPWSVCRPPRQNFQGNLSATVAMILMEPGRGLMEVAPLPALNRQFTTYRLEAAGAARAAE
jgi:isopenicillin-N N-acyltransferase-like protein